MILTTQAQLRAHDHRTGGQFLCARCGAVKPLPTEGGGTGYGYSDDYPGKPVCYACCGAMDRAAMIATGRACLYLARDKWGAYRVTNWPGTLRFVPDAVSVGKHNWGIPRYDVWFWGPDGHKWHGVTIGNNSQVCRCKRTKERAA